MIQDNPTPVRTAMEIAVYLILVLAIIYWCFLIITPFVSFLMWGTIIAVAAYKPFLSLRSAVGEKSKVAVFLFALIGIAVFVIPAWLFAGSIIDSAQTLRASMESGEFQIPPPGDAVQTWPLIGERLYASWTSASTNLEQFMDAHHDQFVDVLRRMLMGAAGIGLSILQLVAATLIAAALLANDQATIAAMRRLFRRLVGDQGEAMLQLTVATIRSITVGVLGIAFIQAVLGGVGMMAVGVPAAGVWALFILILAIAQLPPLLVLLPAIIYVFSTGESTTAAIVFTVWSVFVSFSDAILKPLFLGRGVEAPMLVILLGAIGGMIHSGIVGLFVGSVILALGYKLFIAWLESGEPDSVQQPTTSESESG